MIESARRVSARSANADWVSFLEQHSAKGSGKPDTFSIDYSVSAQPHGVSCSQLQELPPKCQVKPPPIQ